MKNIDINQVAHLYYHEKKSVNEIAVILNCSNKTIYNRMDENGMPRRSHLEANRLRYAINIDLQEIVHLYFEKKMSLEAIAKRLRTSYTAIRRRLIEAGYRCRKPEGPSPKFTDTELTEMARLYHDEELTPAEIACQYDSNASTIQSSLRRIPGFRFRSRQEARALRKRREAQAAENEQSETNGKTGKPTRTYTPPKRLGKVFEPIPLLSPEQVTPERILQLRNEDGLTLDDIAAVCSLSTVDIYNILQEGTV